MIAWNEVIARFFILSGHELLCYDRPSSDPGIDPFTSHLNQEQLNKCLLDIISYYQRAHQAGIPTPNSPEFKCYFAVMAYGGITAKSKIKAPNRIATLSVMQSFTPEETSTDWYRWGQATEVPSSLNFILD